MTRSQDRERPLRSDAALNRERLIQAAVEILREHPGAGMAAVAAAAGVSRGTLYRHFATREALIAAVQERGGAEPSEISALPVTSHLSLPDILGRVAPFHIGEQIVAETLRQPGVTDAAIYLVDISGRELRRLAGGSGFPDPLRLRVGIGSEIASGTVERVIAALQSRIPGVAAAPMTVRGRSIGLLIARGDGFPELRPLAREAAVALAFADPFTDELRNVRRKTRTTGAAELQEALLPPRMMTLTSGTVAGNIRPAYDVSGDLFDLTQNRDATWIAIIDIHGRGAWSATAAAALISAFRAQRILPGATPSGAIEAMSAALAVFGGADPMERLTASSTVGRLDAELRFTWATAGEAAPLLVSRDRTLTQLGEVGARIGSPRFRTPVPTASHRLDPGDRIVLASNGLLEQRLDDGEAFGLAGLERALASMTRTDAASTIEAIERLAMSQSPADPDDDATLVVLSIGRDDGLTGP